MSFAVLLGVGLLGGLGAAGRFLADHGITTTVKRRGRAGFPLGTLVVNLSGAFVLGILAAAALSTDSYRLWGVGLCGGYTTFSTWMLETHRLRAPLAVLNVIGSLVLGVLAVWLGRGLG